MDDCLITFAVQGIYGMILEEYGNMKKTNWTTGSAEDRNNNCVWLENHNHSLTAAGSVEEKERTTTHNIFHSQVDHLGQQIKWWILESIFHGLIERYSISIYY